MLAIIEDAPTRAMPIGICHGHHVLSAPAIKIPKQKQEAVKYILR